MIQFKDKKSKKFRLKEFLDRQPRHEMSFSASKITGHLMILNFPITEFLVRPKTLTNTVEKTCLLFVCFQKVFVYFSLNPL